MIEDWLARREYPDSLTRSDSDNGDGYEKVLELYCLQVLPKLEQWDYANEFLEYESELVHETREVHFLHSSVEPTYLTKHRNSTSSA